MKIIFMGTPDFAVPVLESLAGSRHEVVLVVTQPDRMKGRSGKPVFSPVKECALRHHLPVFQPLKLKSPESVEELRRFPADIMVVAAYGQILSQEILDMTPYGCVNVHGSLLPALRGAAPVQWAVIEGHKESGVTIMQMNAGLDTGDMILKERVEIAPDETAGSLYERLSGIGGPLLLKALDAIEDGTAERIPQNDGLATYAKMLKKEMGDIDWSKSSQEIERLVRGMNPWPSAYTFRGGKQVKIWEAKVLHCPPDGDPAAEGSAGISDQAQLYALLQRWDKPGTVVSVTKDAFLVRTGSQDSLLEVRQIQMEGKKRMPVKDFLLGSKLTEGEILEHGQ